MSNPDIRVISYLCEACGRTIKLRIDREVHKNRRDLATNGLADYIDVHADKEGHRHGVRLSIDNDFNVRTNAKIEVKTEAASAGGFVIPSPKMKVKQLKTEFAWDTWHHLELEIKSEKLKFVLELPEDRVKGDNIQEIETTSELGNVSCKLAAVIDETMPDKFVYISNWMDTFCNSLELASAIHVDLIPEILRYIDHHCHREVNYNDTLVISILIDKSSILIPNKEIMSWLTEFGPGMSLIGMDADRFASITGKLMELDRFSMDDIQNILELDMVKGEELEEEFIIIAMFYLITFDAFDYRLSYVKEHGVVEEKKT